MISNAIHDLSSYERKGNKLILDFWNNLNGCPGFLYLGNSFFVFE